MAHDERMLSQAEIDSLLKRILPSTDKPAAEAKPAPGKPGEPSAKPKETIPGVKPIATVKATEPIRIKEVVPSGQATDEIKITEFKMNTADMPASPRPAEAVKREHSSGEVTSQQKTIAELTEQVDKLSAAIQTIAQLEEKVKQLEAMMKLMPDSTRTLKARVDEIAIALERLKGEKSDTSFLEGFKCSHCHAEGLVALYVKCTRCGKENWMGWWPDEENR